MNEQTIADVQRLMAESQAALRQAQQLLAGGSGAWQKLRDPETGAVLCEHHPSGRLRFVIKWHGERKTVTVPVPVAA